MKQHHLAVCQFFFTYFGLNLDWWMWKGATSSFLQKFLMRYFFILSISDLPCTSWWKWLQFLNLFWTALLFNPQYSNSVQIKPSARLTRPWGAQWWNKFDLGWFWSQPALNCLCTLIQSFATGSWGDPRLALCSALVFCVIDTVFCVLCSVFFVIDTKIVIHCSVSWTTDKCPVSYFRGVGVLILIMILIALPCLLINIKLGGQL